MRILAPFDESAFSEATVPTLAKLAALPGVEIVLCSIAEVTAAFDEVAIAERRMALDAYLHESTSGLPSSSTHRIATDVAMYPMDAATLLIQRVKAELCDMVVIASHGRSGLVGKLLGSVASEIVRSGVAPVLLVHPGSHH